MTDIELMALAAQAAGINVHESEDGTVQRRPILCVTHCVMGQPYGEVAWNPLRDDGDALRLAVKVGLLVDMHGLHARVCFPYEAPLAYEPKGSDPYAATRRAITRAAASLAKDMP